MNCGPDCVCHLPVANVCAVSARGRAGYGFSWGKDGSRNGSRAISPLEGGTCVTARSLAGILHVLKDAEQQKEMKILINISACPLVSPLNKPAEYEHFNCCQKLIKQIAACKTKGVYRRPCCYSNKGFQKAIYQARLVTGTHSLAPFPINDNLFKNGVIGVSIYGDYKMTASGEMKGAYSFYFEEKFADPYRNEMNKCEWFPPAISAVSTYLECLSAAFDLLLHEQYRQVRIKTSFELVAHWINLIETDPNNDFKNTPLEIVRFYYKLFRNVEIEFDPNGGNVLEAKRMVDQLFESTVDGLYWKGGVPVVYTDGSVRGQGTDRAVAGGGDFWGQNDPRNRTCQIYGPQTSTSGEFGAVAQGLRTSIEYKIFRLIIRCDSKSVVDDCNNLDKLKANNWLKPNGQETKNREFLEEIDKLKGMMKSVEFEWVPGHSGNEGNDGADALARKAAKDAYKEVNFSPRYL